LVIKKCENVKMKIIDKCLFTGKKYRTDELASARPSPEGEGLGVRPKIEISNISSFTIKI